MHFETDYDEGGARLYSKQVGDTHYALGVGLRNVADRTEALSVLDAAGRTGALTFNSNFFLLDKDQQDKAADEAWRQDTVNELFEEYQFGPWLIQSTVVPFSPEMWQRGRTFFSVEDIYRAHLASGRELNSVGGVAYPIVPTDEFAEKLERGKRISKNVPESIEDFVDFTIGLEIFKIESNPWRSGIVRGLGKSYVVEGLLADRVLN